MKEWNFTIKCLPLAKKIHSLLAPLGERGVSTRLRAPSLKLKGRAKREKPNIYSAQSTTERWGEKIFYSFQSTNLVKARFTEIGLLTRGITLHFHLNIHVVQPIIKEKILQGTFVKSCVSLFQTLLNGSAETFLSFITELPERQIIFHSMFPWTIALIKILFFILNDTL